MQLVTTSVYGLQVNVNTRCHAVEGGRPDTAVTSPNCWTPAYLCVYANLTVSLCLATYHLSRALSVHVTYCILVFLLTSQSNYGLQVLVSPFYGSVGIQDKLICLVLHGVEHSQIFLSNRKTLVFLWGTKWIITASHSEINQRRWCQQIT